MPGKFLGALEATHSTLRNTASAQIPGAGLCGISRLHEQAPLLGLYDQAYFMILKMSVWKRYSGIYGIPQLENLNARPWGSERSPSYLWQRETLFWKTMRSGWGDDWGQGKFRVRVGRRAVRHTSCKKGCSSSQGERPAGVLEGCSWLQTWIPTAQEWPVGTTEVCLLDLPSGKNLPFSCEMADSLQGQCLHRMSQLLSQGHTLPWWSSEWLSMVGLPGPDLFCAMWNSSDTQLTPQGFTIWDTPCPILPPTFFSQISDLYPSLKTLPNPASSFFIFPGHYDPSPSNTQLLKPLALLSSSLHFIPSCNI